MTRQLISEVGRDVLVRPSPFAMVWQGKGSPHEALAVPGVSLGEGELLVEVELATICRSDVHTVLGQREAPTPVILGHEQVGRVVAVGEGAVSWSGTPIVAGMRVAYIHSHISIVHASSATTGFRISMPIIGSPSDQRTG